MHVAAIAVQKLERRYSVMLPEHTMKTNLFVLTPHGHSPEFISGMLIR